MKKETKIVVSVLMVLVLLVGLLHPSMGVQAANSIDTTKKGSITVTKYKTYDQSKFDTNPGTGEVQDIPEDNHYQTLNNSVFHLYKVLDADEVVTYYNGTANTVYRANDFVTGGTKADNSDVVVHKYGSDEKITALKTGVTGTQGTDGVYKFDNLDVGMYILVEVKGADQVVAPLAISSLISIPMVNSSTSTNSGIEWNYDVSVYPKSKTSEASIELTKVAQDGTTALKGVKFQLFKKDSEGNWEENPITATYTVDDVDNVRTNTTSFADDGTLTTGEDGKIAIHNLPSGLTGTTYKLVETQAPDGYIVDADPIVFTVNTENKVVLDEQETIDAKSRLIEKKETESNVEGFKLELTLRNNNPAFTKEVKENGTDHWVSATHYEMGQLQDYKMSVKIPYNIAQMNTFQIQDIPDAGITDNLPTQIQCGADQIAIDEQVVFASSNGFVIDFTKLAATDLEKIAGKDITIVYTAYLNKDAAVVTGADTKGNENTATLSFDQVKGNDTAGLYKISDTTVVYTYQIGLTKRAESTTGEGIDGVEFELYQADKTTKVEMVREADGIYHVLVAGETKADALVTAAGDNKGALLIKGLAKGTYYLKETKTAAGYNLLSNLVDINIEDTGSTTWKYQNVYTADGTDKKLEQKAVETVTHTGVYNPSETIINKAGFVLPKTGTAGYICIFAIGLVLICGGVILMLSGRKKKIR